MTIKRLKVKTGRWILAKAGKGIGVCGRDELPQKARPEPVSSRVLDVPIFWISSAYLFLSFD
jgi:hypothetical protein